ncbi:MAG TPA: SpoIIE family protein phosphatase [Candidatus Limnocylindrales bacterium]|nr:SpoIIE family protein phosphatase [Candidatus Limnocylindrales bacterium]
MTEAFDELTELYEDSPTGAISSLVDGTIVRVNRTILRWLGYARHEFLGRSLAEVLAPGDRIYYETHYAPLLQMQGEVRGVAVSLLRADGVRLPCMISSVLRPPAGDRPAVVWTTVFDATDRRKYEQELLRAREEARAAGERERALARALQQSLLPPEPPRIPGLDVGAAYHPVGQGLDVGGDFYDIFENRNGDWTIIIGDVAGKGAEAAGVTAIARYTARGAAVRRARPNHVLRAVNEAVLRDRSDRYCTMCCLMLRQRTGEDLDVTVSAGGHPLPLLVSSDGSIDAVGLGGTILGTFEDVDLHEIQVVLRPGDMLIARTDGITDGRRGDEFFGEERLIRASEELKGAPAAVVANELVRRVVEFQDGWPRDDIAVVVVRVPPR